MFRIGAQCGLKPDEVLDMSMDVFMAVVQGYADHIFDLQVVSVHQGYWAGYYGRAKKPKSLDAVISKLFKAKNKSENKDKSPKHKKKFTDVDVDSFLALEQKRLSKI